MLSPTVYGVLPPSELAMSTSFIKKSKSHKNMLNKSGPNLDPCETPKATFPGAK